MVFKNISTKQFRGGLGLSNTQPKLSMEKVIIHGHILINHAAKKNFRETFCRNLSPLATATATQDDKTKLAVSFFFKPCHRNCSTDLIRTPKLDAASRFTSHRRRAKRPTTKADKE